MARFWASSGRQVEMKPVLAPARLRARSWAWQVAVPVKLLRALTVGSAAITAGRPVLDAVPSEDPPPGQDGAPFSPHPSETSDCCENGTSRWKNVSRLDAAAFRFENTGSWASAAAPSFCIAGRSCSRKAGSLFQVAAMQLA